VRGSRTLLLAAIGAAVSAGLIAAAPRDGKEAPPLRAADLEPALRTRADAIIDALAAPRYRDRRAAQQSLRALHAAYLAALAKFANDEVLRDGVIETLGESVAEAAIARDLAAMDPPRRRAGQQFRAENPALFADMYSLSWTRQLAALRAVAKLPETDTRAEHFVLQAVEHASPLIAVEALNLLKTGRYRSDAVVDALCRIVEEQAPPNWRQSYYDSSKPAPHLAALEALEKIASRHAAPLLARMLLDPQHSSACRDGLLATALAATGEKRAIPLLMDAMELKSYRSSSVSRNGKTVSWQTGDTRLLAAIRLTGQKESQYGMTNLTEPYARSVTTYGFAEDSQRAEALKKFRQWWADHKDQAPYKDLTPLALPPRHTPLPEEMTPREDD